MCFLCSTTILPLLFLICPTLGALSLLFSVDQNNEEQAVFSSMNKRPLKLCEPQRKAITVLVATAE